MKGISLRARKISFNICRIMIGLDKYVICWALFRESLKRIPYKEKGGQAGLPPN
jgi:hypothetical protein